MMMTSIFATWLVLSVLNAYLRSVYLSQIERTKSKFYYFITVTAEILSSALPGEHVILEQPVSRTSYPEHHEGKILFQDFKLK
jgi:hypothetical protein